jgi:XTP/dITP diphosphohydrolase
MSRRLTGKIVIATHNAGKLREMRELLAPYGIEAVSAADLGLGEPDETGADFIANALIKAQTAAAVSGSPAFADDSGLCVEGLGGAPGVSSARFAGEAGGFQQAMDKILSDLAARGADRPWRGCFISALAVVWPDGHAETFQGRVDGELVAPRGTQGFGYDALFKPDGHARTFGEMDSQEKHGLPADGLQALSHRARAFQMMARAVLGSS